MDDHSPIAVAPSAGQRTAWLLFAPPAVLAGLRWLLQWQSERGTPTTALPLTPIALDATPLQLLAPLGWALAGLLLIIPGFVTDFFGILLLQPWLRNKLADKLVGSSQFRMQMGGFQAQQPPFGAHPGEGQPDQAKGGGTTIEGEFERKE